MWRQVSDSSIMMYAFTIYLHLACKLFLFIHYILLYDYTVYYIHKPQSVGECVSKPSHQSNHSSTVYIIMLKFIKISLSYIYLLACCVLFTHVQSKVCIID